MRQEEQLAGALATGTEEKCRLIDKLRAAEEASAASARLETETLNVPELADLHRRVTEANLVLLEELTSLAQ